MNLQDFIVNTRLTLRDIGVKVLPDPLLIAFANEGKNDLYRVIRDAKTDFFVTSSNVTISATGAGDPNTISLPTDFSQLKDILCTTLSGVSDPGAIQFIAWDRNDVVFKYLLRSTMNTTAGVGLTFYYDILGTSTVQIVPPVGTTSATFLAKITYVAVPADLALPSDSPSTIPSEYHQYILNYMVTECMRATNDPRLAAYSDKLTGFRAAIAKSVSQRALNEPQER